MYLIFILLISLFISSPAYSLSDGDDVIYAVKSTGGSTQDWGTIAPSTGNFTSILQISPTGLGWPLGDIGSEPDSINGYVYTRQTDGADLDGLVDNESLGSSGNFTIDGALSSRASSSFNSTVSINSSSNNTSVIFTITGTDSDGNTQN